MIAYLLAVLRPEVGVTFALVHAVVEADLRTNTRERRTGRDKRTAGQPERHVIVDEQ